MQDYDVKLGKLQEELDAINVAQPLPLRPRVVLAQNGTQREDPYLTPPGTTMKAVADVDSLFGSTPSYNKYKHEKPEHRLILWARLQGHNVKETAALTGYTPQSVSQICRQPWFIEAFCVMSSAMGKDAFQTFIEGQVLPAAQRLVDLAENGETEQVKLAANREILDRFLGKPVAKTETLVKGGTTQVIYDIARLQEDNARVQRELAARGIGQHQSN